MINIRKMLGAAVLATCCVTTAAMADGVGSVRLYDSYGTGGGGEFRAQIQNDWTASVPSATGTMFEGSVTAAPGLFETFCLEDNETVSLGQTYSVTIDTHTIADPGNSAYDGSSHGGHIDELDSRTAYLYSNFIGGTLGGYDYGTGAARTSSATALQLAVWYIEEEISGVGNNALANSFLTAADHAVNGYTDGSGFHAATWSGLGNVRVANLFRLDRLGHRSDYQSQIVSIPLPLPISMAAAGLLGVAYLSRRRIGSVRG